MILNRPLVFLDLETTGPNAKLDRIVQIALIKVYPDGTEREWQSYVNPEVAIPPEVTKIHSITDDMVKDAPTFAALAERLHTGLMDCDLAGYAVTFDKTFMLEAFKRAGYALDRGLLDGSIVDGYKIFAAMERRDLTSAVKFYLGEEMVGAHDAMNDIRATRRVIIAQLERYPTLPQTVEALHDKFFEELPDGALDPESKIVWRHGEAVLNFGVKHNGWKLRDIPRQYLNWILGSEFSPAVKSIVTDALQGKYPKR